MSHNNKLKAEVKPIRQVPLSHCILPLWFNYRKANSNKFTKQFKNLLSSHHIFFPNNMLHLHKLPHYKNHNKPHIPKATSNLNGTMQNKAKKHTLIRAVASWPVSSNFAISRRICFNWISLLFLSNFIRGIDNFKRVLL